MNRTYLVCLVALCGLACDLGTISLDSNEMESSDDETSADPTKGQTSSSGKPSTTGQDDGDDINDIDDATGWEETGDGPMDDMGDSADTGMVVPETKACLELIDDLESGTGLLPSGSSGDRQGAWYIFNDETGPQFPTGPFLPDGFFGGAPSSDGSALQTLYAARTSGGPFLDWGGGVGFDLVHPGCTGGCSELPVFPMPYDASAFSGVSFYARTLNGDTRDLMFNVPTSGTAPVEREGLCVAQEGGECDAHFGASIRVGPDWTAFEIPLADLQQPAFGVPVAFDPTTLLSLHWQVSVESEFDLAIDEVCFY